nr:hypothetical protein [uncultured Enterobacter sp.]
MPGLNPVLSSITPAQHASSSNATAVSQYSHPVLNAAQTLIETMPKLPGIAESAAPEEVAKHRQNLTNCLSVAANEGIWSQQQNDQHIRPVAVGLQAIFEQALLNAIASGDVIHSDIIFTTANPMTPLCQPAGKGNAHASLMAADVANHPGSYDTVISRSHTVPQLLENQSVSVCTIYSQDRPDAQSQQFYDSVCAQHPDATQFYSLRSGIALPPEFSGANYVVTAKDQSTHLFGLRITQANNPTDRCVVFTKENEKMLSGLCHDYLDVVQAERPLDGHLKHFTAVLQQNF